MIYVLAQRHDIALEWANRRGVGMHDWHYVTRSDVLAGINDPHVVLLGYPLHWTADDRSAFETALAFCDRGGAKIERIVRAKPRP